MAAQRGPVNFLSALAFALLGAGGAAVADDIVLTDGTVAATAAGNVPENRIVADFSAFAGSSENADNLADGLRNATTISLSGSTGGTTTITPPTRPMGNGNVFISLALAKQQLAMLGVTQPTADQIKAALVGGTITVGGSTTAGSTAKAQTVTLPGILTLRSQGMGWGKIAQLMGTKLGPVVSAVNHPSAPATATGIVTAGGAPASRHESGPAPTGRSTDADEAGIVSAAGGQVSHAGALARHASAADPDDEGIVNAAGASISSSASLHSHASTAGIVSGNGASLGAGASHSGFAGGGRGAKN